MTCANPLSLILIDAMIGGSTLTYAQQPPDAAKTASQRAARGRRLTGGGR